MEDVRGDSRTSRAGAGSTHTIMWKDVRKGLKKSRAGAGSTEDVRGDLRTSRAGTGSTNVIYGEGTWGLGDIPCRRKLAKYNLWRMIEVYRNLGERVPKQEMLCKRPEKVERNCCCLKQSRPPQCTPPAAAAAAPLPRSGDLGWRLAAWLASICIYIYMYISI